ncbi:uncharacterized protein [Amphiura filiformis]|uniref:uncharacterized protein isoform X2 n=1 Tax=Amphiura filiformis TaxID=82378 RepID=UPI003B222EF5
MLCVTQRGMAAPNRKEKKNRQGRREEQQDPMTDPMADTETQPEPDTTGTPSVEDPMVDEDADPKCTPWTWSECQPNEGECGKGVKLGIRDGEECKRTERQKPCTVRCKGRRKGGNQKQQPGQQQQDTIQEDEPRPDSEYPPADPGVNPTESDTPEADQNEAVADPRCSPWAWTMCEPIQGECGKGFKIGTRGGPGCRGTLKQKPCFKPCGDGKKGKAQKQSKGQEEDADPRCTPWTFTECVSTTEGECGPGIKMGTRMGPECKKTEKQKDCHVPCEGEEEETRGKGGGGGGRKKGKKPKQAQNQRGRPQTQEDDEDADPRCTPWSFSECEPLEGECGAGVKIGTRSGPKCKKTQKEKDCRVPCGGGKKKGGGKQRQKDEPRPYDDDAEEEVEVKGKNGKKICKYRRGDWGECDEASNTQTRTMELKKGDEDTCPQERYITKPCDRIQRKVERKLDCRYGAGDWGLCNTTSGMRMRVDMLEDKGMEIEGCRTQRIVYKKCALACEYDYTEWSSCDPLSDTRRLEGTLIRTEDTPPDCEQTVMKTKQCFGNNGREKCFFGPWSEYSPCIKGYKYRIRELVAGGHKCELQASYAAKCKEKEMKE